MDKIWLIIQREFLNRVMKKTFLITTLLIPLIFPTIIGVFLYIEMQVMNNSTKEIIHYLDEGSQFIPESDDFEFIEVQGSLEQAKQEYEQTDDYGLLHIPELDLYAPKGIMLYSKIKPNFQDLGKLESIFVDQIKDKKMHALQLEAHTLDSLKTSVSFNTITLQDGEESKSSSDMGFIIGYLSGFLIYMLIFIYGAQVMQSIVEEKSGKVVEVIISSVKPFQLMLGKIIGLASVGLLQFFIWIVLVTSISVTMMALLGIDNMPNSTEMMQMESEQMATPNHAEMIETIQEVVELPWFYLISSFVFYFIGGYLMYAALFAAVGAAVDNSSDAQQFMLPITIPMIVAMIGLTAFITRDHDSTVSIWLSMIPLTSPVSMMGRIGFGVPAWQLALSMFLLALGFLSTTWMAAKIYRIGILRSGSKVGYKTLWKWLMEKN